MKSTRETPLRNTFFFSIQLAQNECSCFYSIKKKKKKERKQQKEKLESPISTTEERKVPNLQKVK